MANSNKCGTCGGVTEAKPVDTSQFPSGSLQPVSDACTCASTPTSSSTSTQTLSCPTKCPPKCPPVDCVTPCEEDHTQEIVINNFSSTVKTTDAFNFPAVGQTAEVKLVNTTSLIPGQILWNQGIGRLHVVSYDAETRKVVLTNLGDSCTENPAAVGQLIPSCTEFAVGVPECNGGGVGAVTAGPFLAADFVAPGNGNCQTAKVTSIIGLAINDIVSIASFLYRIDQIIDTETIVLCDEGDGAPLGQVIEWDPNCDDVPDVPILPISGDNPCSKPPVNMGQLVICDGSSQLTTMAGSQTGQVPVWDQEQEKFVLITLNLTDQCTFLTACFTVDIGDDGPYLVTVDDTSIFEVGQQVRIDGDLFTIDSIEDGTHMRLVPDVTPIAIKEYAVGLQVCLRDCCEFLPEQVEPLLDECFPPGIVQHFAAINFFDAVVPPADIIGGMADQFFNNPSNDFLVAAYTNNTPCRQLVECDITIVQSVSFSNANTFALSEFQLGNDTDINSILPRVIHYFDSSQESIQNLPPIGFFQAAAPDGSGWEWMNTFTGHTRRSEFVDPLGTVNFRGRHRISFSSPNNPAPPPGTAGYYLFVHGRLKVTRLE